MEKNKGCARGVLPAQQHTPLMTAGSTLAARGAWRRVSTSAIASWRWCSGDAASSSSYEQSPSSSAAAASSSGLRTDDCENERPLVAHGMGIAAVGTSHGHLRSNAHRLGSSRFAHTAAVAMPANHEVRPATTLS